MPRTSFTTMTSRRSRARTIVLVTLVLLAVLDGVSGIPHRRSLLRLCSKSLSDALYLACKDRGYNEPFSYSGEDDSQDSAGPGLAEECCYHVCSFKQLEQYCKPDKEHASSASAVEESFWIVNLPYPTEKLASSLGERSASETDHVSETIKCKNHGFKRGRKKGINNREVDKGCSGRKQAGSGKKHQGRRQRRRQRRRRLGKILTPTQIAKSSEIEAPSITE